METRADASDRRPRVLRVFAGVLIILVGLTMLGDRLDLFGTGYSGDGWPLILLALGVAKLIAPCVDRQRRVESRRLAGWLLAVGVWGIITEYHLMGFHYGTSWPLLVIYAGVDMIWKASDERRVPKRHESVR